MTTQVANPFEEGTLSMPTEEEEASAVSTESTKVLDLVSRLLSQETTAREKRNPLLEEMENFNLLINDTFMGQSKTPVQGILHTFRQLQQLHQDLRELAAFPHLENHTAIAIGGAFSAGKSSFINSLLGEKKLLPTDTTPTTSIPTWLLRGRQNRVQSLNHFGVTTELELQDLHYISHEYARKYNLQFGHALQSISIENQGFPWEKILFLDTPGYSNTSTQGQADDEEIARNQLMRADLLIWLFSEKSLEKKDLEFLQSLKTQTPILFIFNKADRTPPKEIREILEYSRRTLGSYNLNVHNIIAYSSKRHQEYQDTPVLLPLLDKANKRAPGTTLRKRMDTIFKNYLQRLQSEKTLLQEELRDIKELHLTLGGETFSAAQKTLKHMGNLEKKIERQRQDLEKQHFEVKKIQEHLGRSLTKIFQRLDITEQEGGTLNIGGFTTPGKASEEMLEMTGHWTTLDEEALHRQSDYQELKGTITKKSSTGITVDVGGFGAVFVHESQYKRNAGAEKLTPGTPVRVCYSGKKECMVTYKTAMERI